MCAELCVRKRVAFAATLFVFCSPAQISSAQQADATPCTLEPGPVHTVSRIIDGETLVLDDGSEVRLVGALAPKASDAGAAHGARPAEKDAINTITTLVLGRTVKLAYGGRHTDRYGRHLAQVFIKEDGHDRWLQGEMLRAGAARAYGLPGSFSCGAELLAHEQLARTAGLGIWNSAVYHSKPAQLTRLLMSRRSQFEIVEGTVTQVSRLKSGVYLDFGSDAKTDFTVRIGKSVLAAHADWDSKLTDLTGKTIEVRGWIERRNGPLIDVADPSQMVVRDQGLPSNPPREPALSPPIASAPPETTVPDTAGVSAEDAAKRKSPGDSKFEIAG
jgi:micrococcal nuclease